MNRSLTACLTLPLICLGLAACQKENHRAELDPSSAETLISFDHREVHLDLGEADAIDRLEIHWPSGTKQALENIPANRHYRITEGEPVPHPIAIAP